MVAVAMLLSIACLVWVLEDFEPEKLIPEIRAAHWGWVGAAVLFDILVYFLQGWRWSLLLRPVANIPSAQSIRAIYVGLFANEILPLRTGEIIRCYLQARWSRLPFSVILASALIERIFDGIWLLACMVVTMRFVDLPAGYVAVGQVLLIVVLVGAALIAAAVFLKEWTMGMFDRHPKLRKMKVLLEDLYIIGRSRYLYVSALASLPYLLLQVLPIYALAHAYGIDIGLAQGFALMVILRLVSVVPQAPGNLGTFQAAAAFGLMLFGVEEGLSKRFAFFLWAVITLPLLIVGFIALTLTELRLRELRREAAATSEEASLVQPES
jgi:uncharacterized protein (TIRG00374 family)